MDFLDSDNMLLVLRRVGQYFEDINTIDPDGDGIYLFRLEDFSQRQFFRGRYEYFPTTSEEYHCRGGVFDVLKLKNGHFSRTATLSRSLESTARNTRFNNVEILLVTQSRVYVAQGNELGGTKRVEVYSAFDGKPLYIQISDVPFNVMCACSI